MTRALETSGRLRPQSVEFAVRRTFTRCSPLGIRGSCGRHAGLVVVGFCCGLAACATNDPLRDAQLAWDGQTVKPRPQTCESSYALTDALIWKEMQSKGTTVKSRQALNKAVAQVINRQRGDAAGQDCWRVSYENHQGLPAPPKDDNGGSLPKGKPYDLLIAEFDDQGERTDVSMSPQVAFEKSEVALIEAQLNRILEEEENKDRGQGGGGLNIIIFTHGWHGSADASDDYSIWFKAILEQTTDFEAHSRRAMCRDSAAQWIQTQEATERQRLEVLRQGYGCPSQALGQAVLPPDRRTVGIEIAWRGDSENIPYLRWANFWDRKGAAQSVAQGGIHDLMARLHKFYIAHSCHGKDATRTTSPSHQSCDAVHLLSIGHSFGALIDWHVLNDDLSAGLLGDQKIARAFGFGDLTVFLNPAFEGERESTLFAAATHRAAPYPPRFVGDAAEGAQSDLPWPTGAQMPSLVTLQSRGDKATHYAFPAARFLTSLFENTPGAGEHARSLGAAGWIDSYQTHRLSSAPANERDDCDLTGDHPAWLCPFDLQHEDPQAQPLVLKWAGIRQLPDYLPLWTVAVDTSIMSNHDDISNPAVVRFIAQLFRAAYEQEELIHERQGARSAGALP